MLIYMHCYTRHSVPFILNRHLREFRSKLDARLSYLEQISISTAAAPREKTAFIIDIEKLNRVQDELKAYEREVIYPLAADPIEIDLDDGVKVNYKKFGRALAKISGLSVQ
jgi:hypothetical protein